MLSLELQWIIIFGSITLLVLIALILDVTVVQNILDRKARRKLNLD